MKIAITGATGHLGSAIIPQLIKKGHAINALVREDHRSLKGLPIEVFKGDLLNPESLKIFMKGCDALIHCTAIISINGDPKGLVQKTNVEGTKLVMETAKQSHIKRVVHISSIHAYEQIPSNEPLDEYRQQVNEKAFAYDRSKKAGQEIALAMNQPGMEVLVLNPTSIIGPYDHQISKMGKVIIDIYKGRLPFVFKGGFDFCDSRDVAEAVTNALTIGQPGENYLLAGKWYSFDNLVTYISKYKGKKIRVVNLSQFIGELSLPLIKGLAWVTHKEPLYTNEALEAIFNGNKKINCAKALRELNYHIRPLEETIRDTIQWFQQNGYLV
jgi:dihydroflavonol-4-reductase